MREDNPNWFARWEEELPPPEELMPLSQTLITPHLALAFDIHSPNHHGAKKTATISRHQSTPTPPPPAEYGGDSAELGSGSVGGGGEEPARTLKRPRLVWTPQLHKRFVDAVAHLGIKNAVPKTIMQLMSVEGLTRENVASHLQKYRLYLRRMQGLSGGNNGGGGGGGGNAGGGHGSSDPATDHLFASSPVPAHFLSSPPGRVSSEHFMPSLMAAAHHRLQPPQQYHHQHRQANSFAASQSQLEHQFHGRHTQQAVRRYEDLESGNGDGGRKILTLFPTGND